MTDSELFIDVMTKAANLSDEDKISFFMNMTITSTAIIRGMQGNEFIVEFLEAAIDDVENCITPVTNQYIKQCLNSETDNKSKH